MHARDSELGNTALHEAVRKNRGGAVQMLLKEGADPGAVNDRNEHVIDTCASLQVPLLTTVSQYDGMLLNVTDS